MSRCGWSRGTNQCNGSGYSEISEALACIGNQTTLPTKGVGTILEVFPVSVSTCAEAMSLIGSEIQKRTGATNMYVTSETDTAFMVNLQLTSSTNDKATVLLAPKGGCNFPIQATWNRVARNESGSAFFQTVPDLIDYVVTHLKR